MEKWIGRSVRGFFSLLLYRFWALPRISRDDRAQVLGLDLSVPKGVFHPSLFFSSTILGRHVATMALGDMRVLDMGTGSGVLALCAARQGASVLALDINLEAVRCAEANARMNGLESRVRVLHSDLFARVPQGERFDLILWNPPFYPTEPEDDVQRAWRAGSGFAAIRRFAESVGNFLAPGGAMLIILSSDVNNGEFLRHFSPFQITTCSSHRRFFETLTIYELRPAPSINP